MWCNEQLGRLQESLNTGFPRNAQIIAVRTDSHKDSRKLIDGVKELYGMDIRFPLLEDAGHQVIARYGLLNMNTSPGPATRRYATPATYIIDKQGVVRWRMAEENWKLRPTSPVITAALRKVDKGEDATGITLTSFETLDAPAIDVAEQDSAASLDGMSLVPGGTFTMGQPERRAGGDSPAHDVELDAFYMDKHEVTNAQYRIFLAAMATPGAHARCHPGEPPDKDHTPRLWKDVRFNGDTLPVVGVDWYDAAAYAAWAHKTLPTEAQWERAARSGVDGEDFPWGDGIDDTRANINEEAGEADAVLTDNGQTRTSIQPAGTKPVGSYSPNAFGLYDLIGNVEEWCADWYDPDYYRHAPRRNPSGPARGLLKVVRGGSWHHAKGRNHTRYTHTLDERAMFVGFRCVRAVPAAETTRR